MSGVGGVAGSGGDSGSGRWRDSGRCHGIGMGSRIVVAWVVVVTVVGAGVGPTPVFQVGPRHSTQCKAI